MRKSGLLAVVCFALSGGLLYVDAKSRANDLAQITYRNDGNTRAGLTISCTSSAWTSVVAVRAARRKLYVINIHNSGGPICLGTATMESDTTCANGTNGVELGTSAYYEDSGEGAVTCRSRAGSGTATLKGFELYDSTD